jgi:hypothetical protein
LTACGHGAEAPLENTCKATLPPRGVLADLPAPPFVPERSTILVNAELPLATLRQALEAKVARRVAEEHDHDIGVAGRLEYAVDRGPFTVSVQGDSLLVESLLKIQARACAKGSCYAGCDPEARVSAGVPLRLGADYKFRGSRVKIEVTRGCEIRALAGLLRVDLTPILQARIAQEHGRFESAIDRELPDLRPEAERQWTEAQRARPLAFGACAVLAPEGLVQGVPSGAGEIARLRFGILARPEVRMRCGEAARPLPLPPLRDDETLAQEGDVHLSVVLPPEAAANAIAGAGEVIDLGRGRARVASASGSAQALELQLMGEVCGAAAVRPLNAWWGEDGRSVHLAATLAPGEDARFASSSLDGAAVARSVERAAIPVALAPDALRSTLPDLARALSDPRAVGSGAGAPRAASGWEVSATVSDARPQGAGLRADGIVAVVRIRGAVFIRAHP